MKQKLDFGFPGLKLQSAPGTGTRRLTPGGKQKNLPQVGVTGAGAKFLQVKFSLHCMGEILPSEVWLWTTALLDREQQRILQRKTKFRTSVTLGKDSSLKGETCNTK